MSAAGGWRTLFYPADHAPAEPLLGTGELDRDLLRDAVAFLADEHVLVGDQRPLRVHGERRAAVAVVRSEPDQHERDGVLIALREVAVVHARRADDAALARLRLVQLGAQARDLGGVPRRPGGVQRPPQPGHLALRLPQRVAHALDLILELADHPRHFDRQAVGAVLQLGDLVLGPRGADLDPRERGEGDEHDGEQHLRGVAQLPGLPGDLLRDPHRGAAAGRRRWRRGHRLGVCLEQVELDGRPLDAEPDDVAVLEERVAGDARAVHVGAVAAAQVLKDVPLGLAHHGGVTGGDIEVALGVEAYVGEGVATETDVPLRERFDLAGARPREEPELRLH